MVMKILIVFSHLDSVRQKNRGTGSDIGEVTMWIAFEIVPSQVGCLSVYLILYVKGAHYLYIGNVFIIINL